VATIIVNEQPVHLTVADTLSTWTVMPPAHDTSPSKRSDAQRNRDRILRAAREAFGDRDANPSMAEDSRRAGVGMATLYRNFPTRLQLLETLYATEADLVLTAAADPAEDVSPGDALRAWLGEFFAFAASKKHVAAELLTHMDEDSPIFDNTKTRVIAAGTPLFDSAQRAHEVRGDLDLEQVLKMLVSIAAIDGDTDYQEPILRTVLDGLIPPPSLVTSSTATRGTKHGDNAVTRN